MKKQINIEQLAMDLLDFCGGALPTDDDIETWCQRRDLNLRQYEKNKIQNWAQAALEELSNHFENEY